MAWNVSGSWNGANSSVLAGEGFTRIGTLTVPALGAGVTATNVPLVIRPQLEFTTLMLSKIKADGGDLRLSSDAAGNSELPKELVKFDKTTGDIVWSNFPSVVEGLVYHVWAQKPAATQPAVGGEFGRNAVWVDYNRVYHLNEAVSTATGNYVDSSGNGDGTLNATNNVTSVTGQIGDATQSLNSAGGSSPLIDTGLVPDATNVRTLEFWVNYSTTSNSSGYAQGSDDANNRRFYVGLDGDVRLFAGVGTGFMGFGTNPNPSGIVAGSWYKQSLSVDGSTATVYVNGVPKGSFAYTFSGTSTSNFTILGRNRATVETRIQGIADLYTIGKNEKSADALSIEYDNQSATTAWWIAEDVSGVTGVVSNSSFPLPSTTFSGGLTTTLPQPDSSASFSVNNLSLNASVSTTLPQPDSSASFSVNNLSLNASVSTTLPQPDSSASFSVNNLSLNASVSTTLPQPDSSASFSVNNLSFNSSLEATTPANVVLANISFSLDDILFNLDASVTLSQPVLNSSFTISDGLFNISSGATLPQPVSESSFQIGGLGFNSALETFTVARVSNLNFSLSDISFSSEASVSLPSPVSQLSFSIDGPSYNIVSSIFGFNLEYSNDAITRVRSLSNITKVIVGNNITKVR
jgi:hypothetical protein